MHVTAIIAAGGRGQRFGGAQPKQFLSVGGRPLLEWSVAAFLAHPAIDEIVVALPESLALDPPAYLRGTAKPLRVVAGGARRQDSVALAFQAIEGPSEIVVVHDAARPFASPDLMADHRGGCGHRSCHRGVGRQRHRETGRSGPRAGDASA